MRFACGRTSVRISSSLAARSVSNIESPVIFPPGRARLATCPMPTGSAWFEKTIGIVCVACRAGSTRVDELAKMTSTGSRTRPAASAGSSSTLSAHRNSITIFLPLTQPSPRKPARKAKGSGRTMSPGPIIADARLRIVGAIVVFLVSFSAARWLPDLMTGSPENVSTPTAGTSTLTSEATTTSTLTSEVTTTSLQQSDNSRSVTPNPLIPIVIRRSTSPEASDLPPQTEISSTPVTVPESVDTVTAPQQLDLRDIENAKRVQQRLIDLGFLYGAADEVWGQRSRRALQEFRAANGIGESDTWDEATQERLLSAPDAKAANTSDISFVGGWGIDVAECRESPIAITARRAEAYGTACEFHSTQRESSNVWRLRAECASKTERWNANIRFTVSTSKLIWSSERGTTTYVRCPMASASR